MPYKAMLVEAAQQRAEPLRERALSGMTDR